MMKHRTIALLLVALLGFSCSTVFSKKTPHEKYADKLDDNDLDKTPLGRQWLAAAKAALEAPQPIQLPYRQLGYFAPDKPRALGLQFTARRGEQLTFTLSKTAPVPFTLYADLFQLTGGEPVHLLFADTTAAVFTLAIAETGSYLLRLQPELFRTGSYSLSVAVGPSLGFPVDHREARTGSFWGASRDGGKRSHEGIDIFAPRLTPAVAAADGVVTGVGEGGLGGKVVWLRPLGQRYTLYYAHLDKQLVQEGQTVKKGTVIGLVGNTGNARNTPAHLHFGIYTPSGPIDPYPFVNPAIKTAPPLPAKKLTHYLRLTRTQKAAGGRPPVPGQTLLVPLAVTATGYITELPDGKLFHAPFAAVQTTSQPLQQAGATAAVKAQADGA